jgi:chromosome partitioning protein
VKNKLCERYESEVCRTVISENVSVAESPSKNMDVFSHNANSSGAKDYAALYEELHEQKFL